MPQAKPSLLAGIQEAVRALGNDARQMLRLRWELAKLELQSDARAIKRLVCVVLAAGVMILTALPLLLIFAAEMLDGRLGIGRAAWLLIFALALIFGGLAACGLAWRRFRRRFTGMQQSLEEVQEDLIWLGELSRGDG
jgi:hypothetical protein